MIYHGYDPGRCMKKFRCPLVMGKITSCPFRDSCSTSSYGRTVYVADGDDARNAGPLVYRSDKWKQIYKNRISTERINNRVLNNYNLHNMCIRNKAKFAFFAIMAGINIHLDSWINVKKSIFQFVKELVFTKLFSLRLVRTFLYSQPIWLLDIISVKRVFDPTQNRLEVRFSS